MEEAAKLASEAFASYSQTSGKARGAFLRRIADGFDAHREELAARAHLETALPMPRLLGEVGRTSGQLRMFAGVVEEGSWVQARIDPALPDRQPQPRPDLRSMLRALGPVAVFGASNFPLAFSVAGGDTASALAAGCPVIVKAHPAHPGTSELAAQIIAEAVTAGGLHPGVFSMLFDSGIEIGAALVKHPLVRAVAFTGSLRAGRALMDLAAARPDPIPCFTEMSSGNPVFILPGALRKGPAALAASALRILHPRRRSVLHQAGHRPGLGISGWRSFLRRTQSPRREVAAFYAAHCRHCADIRKINRRTRRSSRTCCLRIQT